MKEIGRWKGKVIDKDMDTKTLLEIIRFLASDLADLKDRFNKMVDMTVRSMK